MKMKIAVVLVVLIVLSGVGTFFLLNGGGLEGGGNGKFEGTLRVGMECDFAPYNWQEGKESDTNVPLSNKEGFYAEGYDVQIAKALTEHMGADMKILLVPWDDLLPSLKEGKIDMVISGMADTPARRALPDFANSKNYTVHAAEYCIMVKKDGRYTEAFSLADFYGARIIGQEGTVLDTFIDQIPGVVHLKPTKVVSYMFTQLLNDAADGVIIGIESVKSYEKLYPDIMTIRFPRGQGFRPDFTGACAWVRKGDKALLNAVNRALSTLSVEERKTMMDEAEKKGDA